MLVKRIEDESVKTVMGVAVNLDGLLMYAVNTEEDSDSVYFEDAKLYQVLDSSIPEYWVCDTGKYKDKIVAMSGVKELVYSFTKTHHRASFYEDYLNGETYAVEIMKKYQDADNQAHEQVS